MNSWLVQNVTGSYSVIEVFYENESVLVSLKQNVIKYDKIKTFTDLGLQAANYIISLPLLYSF